MTRVAGGLVYHVETGEFERADVTIEHGRVARLGRSTSSEPAVDASGLFVLPGLIDCHVHLVMRGEDADPSADAGRTDLEIAGYAAAAAERTLMAGITTVRDVGGWNYVEMALRRAIEAGEIRGPRLFLAGRLLSVPTPAVRYYPGMYEVADGVDGARAAVQAQLARGADVIKVMATGAMLSPEEEDAAEPQFTPEELRAIVEAAGTRPVAAHAHAAAGIKNAVGAGVASIEHGTFADDEALRAMAAGGTFVVPTNAAFEIPPDGALTASMPAHIRARFEEHERVHAETMRRAHAFGVPVAMGTDAGTPGNHHSDNARECELMVRLMDMTPAESIRAATLDAARLLGAGGDLGSIEIGKWADLVAFEENPLDEITALRRPVLVMKAGEVVRRDG